MSEANNKRSVLDILLDMTPAKAETKQFRHKRLSAHTGEDVIIALCGIGYSRVAEIRRISEQEESELHTVLAGMVEPDLKSKALSDKFGLPTPAEVIKTLFLPGEITEMSREIELLSGFRESVLEELEKN